MKRVVMYRVIFYELVIALTITVKPFRSVSRAFQQQTKTVAAGED